MGGTRAGSSLGWPLQPFTRLDRGGRRLESAERCSDRFDDLVGLILLDVMAGLGKINAGGVGELRSPAIDGGVAGQRQVLATEHQHPPVVDDLGCGAFIRRATVAWVEDAW